MPISYGTPETTITWLKGDEKASIYTCDSVMVNRLRKLAEENPDDVRILNDQGYGLKMDVPVKWIKIRKPKKMNFTDEQKAAMAERLRASRSE